MDKLYSETYLKAEPSSKRKLARLALVALCVLLFAVSVLVLRNIFVVIIAIVLDGVIIVSLPTKNIAYEYIFVDGQIDFDCIYNGNRRKNKARIDMEQVEIVAPENAGSLYNHRNLSMADYSSGKKDDKHFVVVYKSDKGLAKIKFTPDETLLENIKLKGRNKIDY